jgi:hypothetical protein
VSCPNLAPEAYTADNVEHLLSSNEHAYINDPRGVHFNANGRLELSSIFDWYRDDFAASSDGLIEYLAGVAEEPLASRLRSYDGKNALRIRLVAERALMRVDIVERQLRNSGASSSQRCAT